MRRKKASSSNVISYAYSSATLELEVEFTGGRIYTFEAVTPSVAAQFESAPSKGAFIDAYLRYGRFHKGEATSQDAGVSAGLLPDIAELAIDALRPAEIPPPPVVAQINPDQPKYASTPPARERRAEQPGGWDTSVE